MNYVFRINGEGAVTSERLRAEGCSDWNKGAQRFLRAGAIGSRSAVMSGAARAGTEGIGMTRRARMIRRDFQWRGGQQDAAGG